MTKTCTTCRTSKPFEAFANNKGSKDGRFNMCRECKRAYDLEHHKSPAYKAKQAEYRKRAAEKLRAVSTGWFHANRERHRENVARWKRMNPGRRAAWVVAYQARKKMALPKWADLKAIRRMYEDAAALGMHVDHIVPLAGKTVCGLHCEANLQLLTPHQNHVKNNKIWPDMP